MLAQNNSTNNNLSFCDLFSLASRVQQCNCLNELNILLGQGFWSTISHFNFPKDVEFRFALLATEDFIYLTASHRNQLFRWANICAVNYVIKRQNCWFTNDINNVTAIKTYLKISFVRKFSGLIRIKPVLEAKNSISRLLGPSQDLRTTFASLRTSQKSSAFRTGKNRA